MRNTDESKRGALRSHRLRSILAGLALFAAMLTGFVGPAAAASAPAVTGVSPSGGPVKGGQVVLIKGTDFTGATAVTFGDGDVAATSYGVISDTTIVAVVPDATAAGEAVIKVTNATGTNTDGKGYKYGGPTVTKVFPDFAAIDAAKVITITGTGFTGAVASDVTFVGAAKTKAASQIWVVSDKMIVATTPEVASADLVEEVADVVVTRNSLASVTGKSAFLWASGPPTVTALSGSGTDTLSVGDTITLTGTQLLGVTQVNFGSTKVTADITITSATSIAVAVPKGKDGPVHVTVETAAGTSVTNLSTGFNYFSTSAPTISSVFPGVLDAATGGTFLVYGKGFTGVTTAKVSLVCETESTAVVPTSVLAVSDGALIVVVPKVNTAGDEDECDLVIQNPTAATGELITTLADAIRYLDS